MLSGGSAGSEFLCLLFEIVIFFLVNMINFNHTNFKPIPIKVFSSILVVFTVISTVVHLILNYTFTFYDP